MKPVLLINNLILCFRSVPQSDCIISTKSTFSGPWGPIKSQIRFGGPEPNELVSVMSAQLLSWPTSSSPVNTKRPGQVSLAWGPNFTFLHSPPYLPKHHRKRKFMFKQAGFQTTAEGIHSPAFSCTVSPRIRFFSSTEASWSMM